jgi:L-cystine uptake protein TcyP (sodium:dicarboxylate symporter family)
MYSGLLHTHSLLRYFVLILLLVVIAQALTGLMNNKPFGQANNKASLFLLIFTHIQLLVGIVLYFVSDLVRFGPDTMENDQWRYWTVEHLVGMLIAVVLITVARISSKKLVDDKAKHKRLLILNSIALVLIAVIVLHGKRSLFIMSAMQGAD